MHVIGHINAPAISATGVLDGVFAGFVTDVGEASQGFTVYHLEVLGGAKELLEPAPYDFKKGNKHRQYRATKNCILPGGQLSISTGLNGDLQVWRFWLHFHNFIHVQCTLVHVIVSFLTVVCLLSGMGYHLWRVRGEPVH